MTFFALNRDGEVVREPRRDNAWERVSYNIAVRKIRFRVERITYNAPVKDKYVKSRLLTVRNSCYEAFSAEKLKKIPQMRKRYREYWHQKHCYRIREQAVNAVNERKNPYNAPQNQLWGRNTLYFVELFH